MCEAQASSSAFVSLVANAGTGVGGSGPDSEIG